MRGASVRHRAASLRAGGLAPIGDGGQLIQAMAEEGWFGLLNRALVGTVGLAGDKGVGFSAMSEPKFSYLCSLHGKKLGLFYGVGGLSPAMI
ncbi:hypothetical protein CsSME_00027097 [Camellia sinensis var. sinensis]